MDYYHYNIIIYSVWYYNIDVNISVVRFTGKLFGIDLWILQAQSIVRNIIYNTGISMHVDTWEIIIMYKKRLQT